MKSILIVFKSPEFKYYSSILQLWVFKYFFKHFGHVPFTKVSKTFLLHCFLSAVVAFYILSL